MIVRFKLAVALDGRVVASENLVEFTKDVDSQPPLVGDLMFLWPQGMDLVVIERYWDYDGAVVIRLRTLVVDPDEQTKINWLVPDSLVQEGHEWTRLHQAWFTDQDGPCEVLFSNLKRGEWKI